MVELNRRGFLGLGAAAAVAVGASACAGTGSSSSGSGSSAAGTLPTKPVTLEFWSNHPGSSKPLEQKLITDFQAKFPTIKVNLVDAGKNYQEVATKFQAALAGNKVPDLVVVSDTTWFNFALNKRLEPLDGLFAAAKVDLSDYVDSLAADYIFDKQHYALPYSRSTPLFYYNRDVFAKAGLPDRGPETWDEFATWAPKLNEAIGGDRKAILLPDGTDYIDWGWQGAVWSFGGRYSKEWDFTFTSDETVKAATFLKRIVKDEGWGRITADPASDFGAGLGACAMESTGSLSTITKAAKFGVGTAFLPGPRPSCPTGGAGIAVPSDVSDPDRKVAALAFIEFVTNPANTSYFSQNTGYMPVRKSALEDPSLKAFIEKNPNYNTAVRQLSATRSQDYARVFIPNGAKIIGDGLASIAQGADPKATLGTVQKSIESVYNAQIKSKLPR
ncbi:ABC transporter substrate-binding protein [Williamsia sp. CHRR-6]|uniref:ABC transporter substrate-binding protein n=1 Tax=Williamsia sp. CHRR-6 TaxID=2835871 RepID=UPI001BDB5913|nr:ABC transporter substrate-binding protein [Williamsia sp. CHRR-6]MBT0566923.1 ABC transporter substrate-binding protein [Williamsia sp. CHRR-6]